MCKAKKPKIQQVEAPKPKKQFATQGQLDSQAAGSRDVAARTGASALRVDQDAAGEPGHKADTGGGAPVVERDEAEIQKFFADPATPQALKVKKLREYGFMDKASRNVLEYTGVDERLQKKSGTYRRFRKSGIGRYL